MGAPPPSIIDQKRVQPFLRAEEGTVVWFLDDDACLSRRLPANCCDNFKQLDHRLNPGRRQVNRSDPKPVVEIHSRINGVGGFPQD